MPPAKKPASRRRGAARKRPTAKDQAALKRLNKSLDTAQDALASLGKDVSKDLGAGGRDLYKNLQRFVKDARRDSGKLSRALERDIGQLQKRLARSPQTKPSSRKAHDARRRDAQEQADHVAERLEVGVAHQISALWRQQAGGAFDRRSTFRRGTLWYRLMVQSLLGWGRRGRGGRSRTHLHPKLFGWGRKVAGSPPPN